MTHTIAQQQQLAHAFRSQGILARMFAKRRTGNTPRTIRHWTRTQGFVELSLGG